ncbi:MULTISPECIES: SRPBCC domain-containing protein [unclassified Microbacterium]|uniref:SRPBCC family protein n=1 Tax=unclassified Microbacterium TaxID=2609290 RepID=UPI00214AAF62|nr:MULTISPECIES: SRPBCC domain-containing protein [unclassified Microbacterium]MCR2809913.1 SRPBCC domain-containing protein [Microbacterium sp. zg.B185]WIM17781.1 SRPBCC domain-containing protein [Microbacterium sp. zg-B185]
MSSLPAESRRPASAGDVTISRTFDAPRELVFRCMIDPQHLTHFWGPRGTSAPMEGIVVDARPGGAFETTMVNDADGSSYCMRAVFREVAEPERLVWADIDSGMVTTALFIDTGDGRTNVHIRQTLVPPHAMTEDARAGFLSSLDRFNAYARALASPAEEDR